MNPVAPVISTVLRPGIFSTSPLAGTLFMRPSRRIAAKSLTPQSAAPTAQALAAMLSRP